MEFFNVLSVDEVTQIIQDMAQSKSLKTEAVGLMDSVGRIVSKDYRAELNLPEFNRSTVDGYGVICQDVMGASEAMPSFLSCGLEIQMGEYTDKTLKKGEAIYVPTGGMVPQGAEAMVMIEYVQKMDDETLLVHKPAAPGENISFIGDDLTIGDLIIGKGKKITPYDIGLFAAMGIGSVEVYVKPKYSILSTGDEIVDVDDEKKLGEIREINGYALSGLIQQLGGEVVYKTIIKDDFEKIREAMAHGLKCSDIVLISGGSSVGARDYTKSVIESFEESTIKVHGISIKPGKPTIIGQVKDKLVVGLPGHPASALIIFSMFVKKYQEEIQHRSMTSLYIEALLTGNVHSAPGRETYQMVQLLKSEGKWLAQPLYGKSGMMTLLAKASGFIKIRIDQEGLMKDTLVEVQLLQEVIV